MKHSASQPVFYLSHSFYYFASLLIRALSNADVAIVMADNVYHKTSPIDYNESSQIRVVVGQYCAQVTPENKNVIAMIYDGEDPAPFVDSWLNEIHWSATDGSRTHSLK